MYSEPYIHHPVNQHSFVSQDKLGYDPGFFFFFFYQSTTTTSQTDPPSFVLLLTESSGNEAEEMKMPFWAHNNVNIVIVPLQVGASLSFKGIGKGSHLKIRKGGGCKQSTQAARTSQRYKAWDYISRLPVYEGSNKESQQQPVSKFCLVSSCSKRWRRREVQTKLRAKNVQNARCVRYDSCTKGRAEYEYHQVCFEAKWLRRHWLQMNHVWWKHAEDHDDLSNTLVIWRRRKKKQTVVLKSFLLMLFTCPSHTKAFLTSQKIAPTG